MTKVAIVTASDSGIGKTTALMLAERGFDIGVTWHSDEQGARDTCREVEAQGRRAEAIHLDLSTLPQGAQEVPGAERQAELADALLQDAPEQAVHLPNPSCQVILGSGLVERQDPILIRDGRGRSHDLSRHVPVPPLTSGSNNTTSEP